MPLPRASSPDCLLCSNRQGHTLVRLLGYSQGLTGSCNSTALSAVLYARAEEPLHNTCMHMQADTIVPCTNFQLEHAWGTAISNSDMKADLHMCRPVKKQCNVQYDLNSFLNIRNANFRVQVLMYMGCNCCTAEVVCHAPKLKA